MKNIRVLSAVRRKPAPVLLAGAMLLAACSLLLFPGCQNPLRPIAPETGGTGTFSLTIGGVARTIVPVLSVERFERFHIAFEPAAGCPAGNTGFNLPLTVSADGAADPIDLPAGRWDITVTAFTNAADDDAAATGGIPDFLMSPYGVAAESVVLRPVIDGQGTFSWEGIVFADVVLEAEMEIFEWDDVNWSLGDSLEVFPLVYEGDPVSGATYAVLPAGQYFVVFRLFGEDADGEELEAEVGRILHVYRNIATELPADMFFTDFVFPGLPYLLGTATVTGMVRVGETLTAAFSLSGIPGSETFRWYRADTETGPFVLIDGEAGNTLTLTEYDEDMYVRVAVGRPRYLGYVASLPQGPVAAAAALTVADQIAALRNMTDLPYEHTLTIHIAGEHIAPQALAFDGEEIEITLTAGDGGNTLTLAAQGAMFTVGAGVTLVLDGVTLVPSSVILQSPVANNRALVVVTTGGTLTMNAGSAITGNINTAAFPNNGGGVRVNAGGTFVMNGGEISGNTTTASDGGGGVFNLGTFNMNAGTISNNTAVVGGGVANEGTFNMNAGAISNNTSTTGGGGVNLTWGGTLNMHGGTISGNTATAATGNGGGVRLTSPNSLVPGTLNMYGGVISGNTAQQAGGGVANWTNGRFRMHGGEISGNTAHFGGGGVVNFGAGMFTMSGGTISNNTAPEGGGLNNQQPGAQFFMGGGTIHGIDAGDLANTASGAALLSLPGTDVRVAFGALNLDHTPAAVVDFPQTNINITLDVDDGEIVVVSPTGIEEYLGDAVRFVAFVDDQMHVMSGWFGVPATGIGNFNFPTIPGNWTVGLQFAPIVDGSVQVAESVLYTVTRDLVRGTNEIPLGEFDFVPPTTVTFITVTDVTARYAAAGAWRMRASNDGGATWASYLPGPGWGTVGPVFPNNSLSAAMIAEPGDWLFELHFHSNAAGGFAHRGTYRATATLGIGPNVIPFAEFVPVTVTVITIADIPAVYDDDDLHIFADGLRLTPVAGLWVNNRTEVGVFAPGLELGPTEIRLEFRMFPGGALRTEYVAVVDLVAGDNVISVDDFEAPPRVTSITIYGLPYEYRVPGADADLSIVGGALLGLMELVVGDRVTFDGISLEPGTHELQFDIFFPYPYGNSYTAEVELSVGDNYISFAAYFAPLPAVSSVTVTGVGDYVGTEVDLHVWTGAWTPVTSAEVTGDSVTLTVPMSWPAGDWTIRLAFWEYDAGDWDLVGLYVADKTLVDGANEVALGDFDDITPTGADANAVPFGGTIDGRSLPAERLTPRLEGRTQPESRGRHMPAERLAPGFDVWTQPADGSLRLNEWVPPAGESRSEPLSPGNGLMQPEAFDLPVAPQTPAERLRQR